MRKPPAPPAVAKPAAAKPAAVKPAAVKPARSPLAPHTGGTGKKGTASLTPPFLGAGGRATAKRIPVKAAPPAPPAPVRVIAETSGASGRAWRLSSRYAVAYLRDAALAGELLAAEPRHLAQAAMAVYYDRKGKAFAWQVRFDAARWEEVVGRLG